MPRMARGSVGNLCYHVLNRGNGRAEVFHKSGDYAAFLEAMAESSLRLPSMRPVNRIFKTDQRPAIMRGATSCGILQSSGSAITGS
jgi:hypothetical protein